jgi:ubiquinone/menaquinone biosynthesis C-methylase UbiE
MAIYNRFILPNLIDTSCKLSPIMKQRAKIVPDAEGVVVEIGMGAAPNLGLYDPQKVRTVIGIEPNAGLRKKAARAMAQSALDVRLLDGLAQELPLDSASADTVVLTYTMCSLGDVPGAMSEIRRILKPGGRLLICEHGAAPDAGVLKWQQRLEPVWKVFAGGCHLSRPIDKLVEHNGFRFEKLTAEYMPKTPKIVAYDYIGAAKAS